MKNMSLIIFMALSLSNFSTVMAGENSNPGITANHVVSRSICQAEGGSEGGSEGGVATGGGDTDEIHFGEVASNIYAWIKSGNADTLKMPANISLQEYKSKMAQALSSYKITFTDKVILVYGEEKTCRNFIDQGRNQIECNIDRFKKARAEGADQIYQIVHHEFAGLIRAELNNGSESDYSISNQLSAYLQYQVVKRLPVQSLGENTIAKQRLNGVELSVLSELPAFGIDQIYSQINSEYASQTGDPFNGKGWMTLAQAVNVNDPLGNLCSMASILNIHVVKQGVGGPKPLYLKVSRYGCNHDGKIILESKRAAWINKNALRLFVKSYGGKAEDSNLVDIQFDSQGTPKLVNVKLENAGEG